ncbi:MAG: FtsX-like permease family protein [Fibrobacterota bacterium]
MTLPFELFIARRYLWGKKKVSFISTILVISIAGVFLGTLVLILTLSIMNGFEHEVKKNIVGSFAHVKIQSYHHEPIMNPDSLMAVILKNPKVEAVAPLIEDKFGVSSKEVRDGIIVKGVDLEGECKVTDLAKNLKFGALNLGPAPSVKGRDNPGIILGSYVADKLRVAPGDEIILMSLRGEEDALAGIMPKMKRMTVTGLYESGMYEYDANLAFISLATAQDLLGMKGVMAIEVKIRDPEEAGRVGAALQESLGYPYYSHDWIKQYATLIKWMNSEKFIAFIVVSMIVLVAIFNIISSLLMVIMEKTGEIGILLSMGATPRNIRRIFLYNGLFVGVIGTLAGTAAGLLLCFLQIKFQFIKLPGDVYFISTLPMIVNAWDVIAVVVTANVLALLFSFYPAYKAARLNPVEALVYK